MIAIKRKDKPDLIVKASEVLSVEDDRFHRCCYVTLTDGRSVESWEKADIIRHRVEKGD